MPKLLAFLESPNLGKGRISDEAVGFVVSVLGPGPGWDAGILINHLIGVKAESMVKQEGVW